jgi:hypothetical protein
VLAALDLATNREKIVEAILSAELNNLSCQRNGVIIEEVINIWTEWQPPRITVYTFGSPRIGNLPFSRLVRRKVETIYRVVANGDLVTMLPKIPFVYRHAGIPVIVDEEVPGSIVVKPSVIENSFLRRNTPGWSIYFSDCIF